MPYGKGCWPPRLHNEYLESQELLCKASVGTPRALLASGDILPCIPSTTWRRVKVWIHLSAMTPAAWRIPHLKKQQAFHKVDIQMRRVNKIRSRKNITLVVITNLSTFSCTYLSLIYFFFQQQKFIFHSSEGQEVQDGDTGKVGFFASLLLLSCI